MSPAALRSPGAPARPLRPALPPPGEHGGDARVVAAALGLDASQVLDLSASLNPFAPDPGRVLARHLGAAGRYPDERDREVATAALARAMGVDPGRLLLTNGGAEAIALVAGHLGRGWAGEGEFSLYRRHIPDLDPAGPHFRSDPRNPTGLLAPADASAGVWDEAFYPLATGRWTRGAGAQGESIVVGSLTKVLACPGLRLGYVLAPAGAPEMVASLAVRQAAWSVSTLALASLPDLLEPCDLPAWQRAIAAARADLVGLLAAHGLVARPSVANFVLVDGAAGLRERLAPQGVVVRDAASFGLPGSVRIAVPDAAGLQRLGDALARTAPGRRSTRAAAR